jgi:N-acetylneuraminic acid mutarotase
MKNSVSVFIISCAVMLLSLNTAFAKGGHADSNGPFIPMSSVSLAKSGPADVMGQWSSRADIPVAMGYNTAVYYNNAIYNFSGLSASALLSTVYKLDLASNTWDQAANMPKPRALAMSVVIDNMIYLIGGYSTGSPFTTEGTVLVFDPATNRFTEKARMPVPVYAAGYFVHEGRIWILGGGTTSFQAQTDVVQIYDPASDTWTQSTSKLPRAMRSFSAVIINGTPYTVGGYAYAGTQGQFFPQVYKGSISGNDLTWTQLADFPGGAIMRHSMGTDGKILYLTGGYTAITAQTGVMSNLTWAYNPLVDGWRGELMKPTAVSYGSNLLYDGDKMLYQVAGQTSGGAYVKAVEAYDFQAASKPTALLSATGASFWAKRTSTYSNGFYIGNTGGEELTWSAAVSPNSSTWMSTSGLTSGKLNPGGQSLIAFTVNPNSLTEGQHTGTIEVTTNDPDNATLTYTVQITVQELDVDEPTTVLVEQFTGTWCQYCPFGADSLAALKANLGNRVARTSWHSGIAQFPDPMEIPAWQQMDAFLNVTSYPSAAIHRIIWPGATSIPVGRGDWGNYARFVVNNFRSPIGLDLIDKTYNPATKQLSFKVKVFFHQGMNADLRLNALITEDGINARQVKWTQTGQIILDPYIHYAVVRGIYPDAAGMPLSTSNTFATQTEVVKEFSFTSPHGIDDSTSIVLYVHRLNGGAIGPVQQSYSEPLMLGLTNVEKAPAPAEFVLSQNYPNPFNPSTTISFALPVRADVKINLSDALGRSLGSIVNGSFEAGSHSVLFDARELPSGNYFMTMISGDVVLTRSMTLMK